MGLRVHCPLSQVQFPGSVCPMRLPAMTSEDHRSSDADWPKSQARPHPHESVPGPRPSVPVRTNGRWGFHSTDHLSDQSRHANAFLRLPLLNNNLVKRSYWRFWRLISRGWSSCFKASPRAGFAENSGNCSLRATLGHVEATVAPAHAPSSSLATHVGVVTAAERCHF